MQTKTSQKSGFTLVEIMIVVAIIGLLAAIAIPNFIKAREKSQASACISNMKQIEGAVEQFATEAHKKAGEAVAITDLVSNYIKANPVCPSDSAMTFATSYTLALIGTSPAVTCIPGAALTYAHKLP